MRRAFAVSSAEDAPLTELQTDSFPVELVTNWLPFFVCPISQGPGVCFVSIVVVACVLVSPAGQEPLRSYLRRGS